MSSSRGTLLAMPDMMIALIIAFLLGVLLIQHHELQQARRDIAGWKLDYEWLEKLVPEEQWDKVPEVFTPAGRPIMVTVK